MTLPARPVIRPPGTGDHYPGPATHTIKLAARQTGGQLTVEEFTCPPGFTGPPAHIHHAHDETFVVLTGRMLFTVDGNPHNAAPGTVIYAPRETVHSFANPHDQATTVLGIYTPAGYENYFADLATAMNDSALTPETLAAILQRYATDIAP